MLYNSFVGAGDVTKEEPKQRQCVSDVHIGVVFGGTEMSLSHSGSSDAPGLNSSDGMTSGAAAFVENCFEESGADVHKVFIGGCGEDLFSSYGRNRGSTSACGYTGGDIMALLSKGVKYVTDYINSLSGVSPDSTNLHFYVSGISYGAAPARIFCHLLLRGKGGNMKYEQDFQKYRAKKLFVNGRLKFLEEYQDRQKTIEAVGLYDIESSMGFLTMKDGTIRMCHS